MKTNKIPSHEEITLRAEAIWQERGRIEGRDREIWLEAERQLYLSMVSPSKSRRAAASRRKKGDGPAVFDEDNQLTHKVEQHLAEMGQPTTNRSPTSL